MVKVYCTGKALMHIFPYHKEYVHDSLHHGHNKTI